MKTTLLTGISGYIGLHCAKELLEAGYGVRGTVRSQAKGQEVRDTLRGASVDISNLTLVELDLTSDQGWNEAAAGCDYVMHVASPFVIADPKDPQEIISPAVEGPYAPRAKKAGVKRGFTSSIISMMGGMARYIYLVIGQMSIRPMSAAIQKAKHSRKRQLGFY